jgi:anion-transporting  ArsA/GET3 family ATPase
MLGLRRQDERLEVLFVTGPGAPADVGRVFAGGFWLPSVVVSAFPQVKLHVVSGKGGTGKTTLAAALALAIAAGGRQVLLAEVEGRQGIAQLFDTPPLPYEERKVALARDGGEVYALAIDPEAALLEYLEMFYNLKRAGSMLNKLGAIDFATTIAPGLRDVLLTGKVMEAATRERRGGGRLYDAVVLDAPPTGRIARFLNVNTEVAGLARMGPVRQQADSVMNLLRSRKTAVHLVTVLEEMPVQETCDGVAELRRVDLPVGAVLVNMVREPLLDEDVLEAAERGRLDTAELTRGLKSAGIEVDDRPLGALVGEAADHAGRVRLEMREREVLHALDRPTYELPLLTDAADLAGLYDLASMLGEQGMV